MLVSEECSWAGSDKGFVTVDDEEHFDRRVEQILEISGAILIGGISVALTGAGTCIVTQACVVPEETD